MTLDEAINILESIKQTGEYEGDPYDSKAVELGIEALKLIRQHPTIRFFLEGKLLPGETEE
jgi:hypothetical protein